MSAQRGDPACAGLLFALWSGDLHAARRLLALAGPSARQVVIVVRMPGVTATELVAATRAVAPLVVAAGGQLGVNVGGGERGCSPPALLRELAALPVDWLQLPERAEPVAAFSSRQARLLCSCHDVDGLARRIRSGADACTLSPIWPTPSKAGQAALGRSALEAACRRWPDLIVALGGVDGHRARLAFASGVAGIAALSTQWGADAADLISALPAISR